MKLESLAGLTLLSFVSLATASPSQQGAPFLGVVPSDGANLTIDQVVPDSPAGRAGLRAGDQLLMLGTTPVSDRASLEEALSGRGVGERVPVVVGRSVSIELGQNPDGSGRPWIGVSLETTDGVRIGEVAAGAPAQQAGLLAGDRIVQFDGQEVETFADLQGAIAASSSPTKVGIERRVEVQLGALPAQGAGPAQPSAPQRPQAAAPAPSAQAFLGVVLADDGGQVTVTEVVSGSPAEAAGLSTGDVLRSVDGELCSSAVDVVQRVREKSPGESLALEVAGSGGELVRRVDVALGRRPVNAQAEAPERAILRDRLAEVDARLREHHERFAEEMRELVEERARVAAELGESVAPLRLQLGTRSGDGDPADLARREFVEQARIEAHQALALAHEAHQRAESERARAVELAQRLQDQNAGGARAPQMGELLNEIRHLREDVNELRDELARLRAERERDDER